jgi:hypothetical protein
LSRINNSVAVHHAVRIHQQSGQIARQNRSRLLRVNRAQVAELVQQAVEVGPTTEDLQRFIDIISQEVEDPGLEFAQVEAEIREATPSAGVLQFLSSSQNRTELVSYLGLLLVVIQTVLMLTQKPVVVATPGPGGGDHRAGCPAGRARPAARASADYAAGLRSGTSHGTEGARQLT